MKKILLKKSVIILISSCVLAMCAGCSKEETKTEEKTEEKDIQIEVESIESPETDEPVKTESEPESDYADELYDKFLNGEEKVTFVEDVPGTWQTLFDYDPEAFDYSKEYTKDEILEAFATEQMSELGSDIAQKCTCYNIDLGNDGIPEICVEFSDFQDIMDWAALSFVIKEYDGKLKCIYTFDSRSRYDYCISYSGVISSYGSGGADYHVTTEAFLDADGKYVPLYEELYCGPYSISGYMAEPFDNITDRLIELSEEGYNTEVTLCHLIMRAPRMTI